MNVNKKGDENHDISENIQIPIGVQPNFDAAPIALDVEDILLKKCGT